MHGGGIYCLTKRFFMGRNVCVSLDHAEHDGCTSIYPFISLVKVVVVKLLVLWYNKSVAGESANTKRIKK